MGRGMKKWMAFQSLTPQYEGIRKILHDQKKISRPILDEEQMNEINRVLVEAYKQKRESHITLYHDGFFTDIRGYIQNIQAVHQCTRNDYRWRRKENHSLSGYGGSTF